MQRCRESSELHDCLQLSRVKLEATTCNLDIARLMRTLSITTETGMNLCPICENLDIRKLLLRADEDGFSKYSTLEEKLERAETVSNADDFFSHQTSLDAVRIASSACELCAAIWLDYIHYRTRPYTNHGASSAQWATTLTAPSAGDLGAGQIYITAAPRNTAKHGKPQLVAFRCGQNHSVSILGWFDVYTDHRMTPSPGSEHY